MFLTRILLAESVSKLPLPAVKSAAAQLLPPISLYRRLLRAHRSLEPEMRVLGDDYVKAEFRRTRKTDNPIQLVGFLSSWKSYLDDIETSQGKVGKRLEADTLEKLSPEQLGQLYELMQATKDIYAADAVDSMSEGDGSHGGKQ